MAASGNVTVTADTTGLTDATQAFVSALNQINALGGGTLTVPPGRYSIQPGVLNVRDNTTVLAAGAALVASASGYSLLGVSGANIEVDGLTVDGSNVVQDVVEIGKGSSNITFRGVTAQNAGQGTDPSVTAQVVGIRVEGDGRTMLFDGITVRHVVATHSDGSSTPLVARGLLLDTGGGAATVTKSVTVQNSSFSDVGPKDNGDCLVIQNSGDTNAALVIFNNNFDYCHKRAIKLQVGGVTVQRNTINNPFFGNNAYQALTESGPNGTPTFDMFSAIGLFSSNMAVIDNTIGGSGSFYQAIEIDQASYASALQNLTIQRNTISNGAGSATGTPSSMVRSAAPVAGLAVMSNSFTNAADGLYFQQPISGATITCNTYVNIAAKSANANAAEQPCTGALDQVQTIMSTGASGTFAQGASGRQISAQTFRAGVSGALTKVSVYAWIQNACTTVDGEFCTALGPGDLQAQLRTVDGTGVPTDTIVGTASVPQAQVGLSPQAARWVDLTFAAPPQVTAGTAYALALTSASAGGMYYWGLVSTGDPSVTSTAYPNGQAFARSSCCGATAAWGAWSAEPYMDFAFKTYVASAPVNNPAPTLSAISPTSAKRGAAGLQLTATGANFVGGSTVQWNGVDLPTTPDPASPATRLLATVPSADLATASTPQITVSTPAPGGGASGPLSFFITDTGATVDAEMTTGGFAAVQLSTPGVGGATTTVTATPSAGNGVLTLAHYATDPVAAPAPSTSAAYYDVHVATGSSYTSISLVICNGGNLVYWWNAATSAWAAVTPQQLEPQTGCVDLSLTPQSAPNLTQLAGTPFALVTDKTPPVTTALFNGKPGNNGWYVGPVTLTLNATDDLSGVRSTSYSTDGGATWQTYSAPILFSRDGTYTVQFRSTDRVGNVESVRTTDVKIDQTAPTIACTATPNTIWPPDHKMVQVAVACQVQDTGSGPAGYVLTDITSNEGDISSEASGFTVGRVATGGSLVADRSGSGTGRIYTLTYTGTDLAGNTATARVLVTVPRDQSP